MKKILFLIVSTIIMYGNAFAQTNIPGGEVSGTWTKANSPYLIQGAIMIANDSTLTIEPGVKVEFQGEYKLLVFGRLLAVGTLSDSILFTANDTITGWRGIRFDSTLSTNDTSAISYCKFTFGLARGNNENANGGALYFRYFSKAIISNSLISQCTAVLGGGIYCYSSNPNISNNVISNNLASVSYSSCGGGIYCFNSSPTISNNTIFNNYAAQGGGVFCYDSSPVINNNSISYNTTEFYGAGIYCRNSSSTISNNIISNNYASQGGGGNGGGIYSYNSVNLIIHNNTISYNHAISGGGIDCSQSSSTISYNTISNNSAYSSAGINCSQSNTTISNNIISYNYTSGWGGNGGGIGCSGNTIISNTIISNNYVSPGFYGGGNGGGISCGSGNTTISNTIISNNSATLGFGGGVCCKIGTPTISNTTISNNTAKKGGALYCLSSSNPNLLNSILWGNTSTIAGNQVHLEDDTSDPNFYFCNVQGGKTDIDLDTNVFYSGNYLNNIDSDPLFITPSAGIGSNYNGVNANWSLQDSSPCINAGDSSGTYPSTDKAGNPRICDGRIDIGAYEYQKSPCNTVAVFNEELTKEISLFPNPTDNIFYLDISPIENENVEITVINILGKEVIKTNYEDKMKGRLFKEIDMNGLGDQMYFVRIKINEKMNIRKICKIR